MPDQVERPGVRAVLLRKDGRLQRNLVADLPVEPLGEARPDDRAGARVAERLALLRRHLPLRIQIEEILRHRLVGEEVPRVLVDAAEPVGVGHLGHARHGLDARVQALRQRHREADLGDRHEPIDAGDAAADVVEGACAPNPAARTAGTPPAPTAAVNSVRVLRRNRAAQIEVEVLHAGRLLGLARPACPCPDAACDGRTRPPSDRASP